METQVGSRNKRHNQTTARLRSPGHLVGLTTQAARRSVGCAWPRTSHHAMNAVWNAASRRSGRRLAAGSTNPPLLSSLSPS